MIANNTGEVFESGVDDFNEDTCEMCFYDVHSTENNVEVHELFEDDRN